MTQQSWKQALNCLTALLVYRLFHISLIYPTSQSNVLHRILNFYPFKIKALQHLGHDLDTQKTLALQFLAKWQLMILGYRKFCGWMKPTPSSWTGNTHNCCIWASDNLYEVHIKPLPDMKVTVWWEFIATFIIRLYIFLKNWPFKDLPSVLLVHNSIMMCYRTRSNLISSNEAAYKKPYSCKIKPQRTLELKSNNCWGEHLQMHMWSVDVS